jgi:hypothetical protein
MSESYTPKPGDQVRVRRYDVPVPELFPDALRRMVLEVTGTIATVRELAGGHLITLQGDPEPIFTGSQFTGQAYPGSWTLQTAVVPLADVAAHDQAELDAQVALAEAEEERALALWERARDAEVTARQRHRGAQERLELAMGKAGRHRAEQASLDDLAALTERRKADRAVMARYVADLARAHGLVAGIVGERPGEQDRTVKVVMNGPHTLGLTVRFQGHSPQCEPDTYVLSWHMRPWDDEGKGWELASGFADARTGRHDTKATDVANGWPELVQLLTRRFEAIQNGSAFVLAG